MTPATFVLYACFAAMPVCEQEGHHIVWSTYISAQTCEAEAKYRNETPEGKAFPFHCSPISTVPIGERGIIGESILDPRLTYLNGID